MNSLYLPSSTGHIIPVHVTPDGVHRKLASISSGHIKGAAPTWGNTDAAPEIPMDQWTEKEILQPEIPILDQGSGSGCIGHGLATMMMKCRHAAGATFHLLSPTFLYDQVNGEIDSGGDPADGIKALLKTGTCLMDTVGEDATIDRKKLPRKAYREAKRFMVKPGGVWQGNSFTQLVSMFLLGVKAGCTIHVGPTFELDRDGIVTFTPGPGNHWIAIGDRLKRTRTGVWALEIINSWGYRWGINGRAFITVQHIDGQPYLEIFGIAWTKDDPMDPRNIPIPA